MASVTILETDQSPSALASWQICQTLKTGDAGNSPQTAVTAAKLSQSLRDVDFAEAFEVIDVASYGDILIQIWGTGANDATCVLDCYGWSADGPGEHFGQITGTHGNFTSAASTGWHTNAHPNIKAQLASGTAYRGCDTYADGADYWSQITVRGTDEADFPNGGVKISFQNLQYKYFGTAMTTYANTTSAVVIFKPLSLKTAMPQTVS